MGQVNQPGDIISQIADLQRQIDELRRAVGLSSATISRGGLRLTNGAFFEMTDAGGNEVVWVGPDTGSTSQVFQLWRPGGQAMLATQKDVASGRYFMAFHDFLGNQIFADDVQTGGLARPYLEMPCYLANTSSWPSTTSASFTSLWFTEPELQHPKIDFSISITDNGASGQVRLLLDGSPLGSTFNYTAGSPTFYQGRLAHGATLNNLHKFEIQALRSSGAGAIFVQPYHIRGVQS